MLRAFRLSGKCPAEIPGQELREPDLRTAAWIDLVEPTESERQAIEALYPASLPDADEVEEIEASARYFTDAQGIHVHSSFLYQTEGRHETTTVAFTLRPDQLLTLRETELADFRLYRMRARRRQVEAGSAVAILATIFDQKVENLADTLEDLHLESQIISHLVLEDVSASMENAIDQLAHLEDSSGKVRLCLLDTQRSISFLIRHIRNHPAEIEALREVLRDLDTLMAHTNFLFEKVNFLMDAAQGFINIEQNQIIKIFSIAAVVFLPPTLVASIYGMNFQFMPELDWPMGYPIAVGIMVLSGLAPYWYFKRKGWLK
ncbi:MAG: magnesium/cobalt transporter CorA [Gammaproteobacteria bacterium]|nr:magnesium/cobalt transporter CorA [Gammaproteobacteria bacterium]